jgi:uncharacterized protein (TIGR00369 family)
MSRDSRLRSGSTLAGRPAGRSISSGYPRFLGLETVEVEEERSLLRLPFDERLTTNGSLLHGGLAPSLVCIGGRILPSAAAGDDEVFVHTASLHVSYVSAAFEQDVYCETRLLRRTTSVSFVESAIQGTDGTQVANAHATVRYRHAREAGPTTLDRLEEPFHSSAPQRLPPGAPFLDHLGLEIEDRVDGRSRLRLGFREELAGNAGFHEAALFALFDVAGAMSAHSACGPSERPMRPATIALQALGLTPSLPAEDVVAVSRCVRRDGDFFWNDVRIAVVRTNEVLVRGGLVYRIAQAR